MLARFEPQHGVVALLLAANANVGVVEWLKADLLNALA